MLVHKWKELDDSTKYDLTAMQDLIGAGILQAIKDYAHLCTAKNPKGEILYRGCSAKAYLLSLQYERHAAMVGLHIKGEKLVNLIENKKIHSKYFQKRFSIDDTLRG